MTKPQDQNLSIKQQSSQKSESKKADAAFEEAPQNFIEKGSKLAEKRLNGLAEDYKEEEKVAAIDAFDAQQHMSQSYQQVDIKQDMGVREEKNLFKKSMDQVEIEPIIDID